VVVGDPPNTDPEGCCTEAAKAPKPVVGDAKLKVGNRVCSFHFLRLEIKSKFGHP
jgi:hypothetical protein